MKEILTKHLRKEDSMPQIKPPDQFWAEFREKAENTEREAKKPTLDTLRWLPLPLLAAAASVVLAFIIWPKPPETKVLKLNVITEYQSVMMLNTQNGGTIVWIDT